MGKTKERENQRYLVLKQFEDLVSEMNYVSDAVIVEGLHDQKTLKILGYRNPIISCSRLSDTELTDLAATKFSNVIILTDFDKEGVNLNKKFLSLFEKRGIKVDRFYRRQFQILSKEARIRTVEDIYRIKLNLFNSMNI